MFRRFFKRRRDTDPAETDPERKAGDPEERAPEGEGRGVVTPETSSADPDPAEDDEEPPAADSADEASAQGAPPRPEPLEPSLNAPRPAPEGWSPLGRRSPDRLSDARLQLHHLVQVLAGFGATFIQAEEDDSHRAMTWSPQLGGFRSGGADLAGTVFMVVRPFPLEIQIRAVGDVHRYVLPGHTLQEAWDWAESELALILGRSEVRLRRPEFDIPDHRVARHALFDASPAALEELVRWFDDAWLLLQRVRAECPEFASPVRSWPHHFDMATLLEFGEAPDGEPCTVGVGLSPGDDDREEPYLYVSPWPRPESAPDHPLPAGAWEGGGWVGAVLTGEELVQGSGDEQEARARAFVDAALTQARELLP